MENFDDLLAKNHLGYTTHVDDEAMEQINHFWTSYQAERGGVISDADIEFILNMYKDLDLIADADSREVKRAARLRGQKAADARQEAAAKAMTTGEKSADADKEAAIEKTANGEVAKPKTASAKESPEAENEKASSYEILVTSASEATNEHPLMIIQDADHTICHHQIGDFTNPKRLAAFEYAPQGGLVGDDDVSPIEIRRIVAIDKRFIKLWNWLGEIHAVVRLSGRPVEKGYAVYKIRAYNGTVNGSLSRINNSFLQLVIRRLQASEPPEDLSEDDEKQLEDEADEQMILTDLPGIMDYMTTAGDTLPPAIRSWASRNIMLANSDNISTEEQRHAQRALSLMLHVQWQNPTFPPIDPAAARRILDEELYGMNKVKQRVIETIIQINRTHTLPGYGLLLVGPAGTGKSQIAYAVARILGLSWTSLDMSTIHDSEALTGTPRVYSNAKPGRIMEAFSYAGSSNMVFIINELDKADTGSSGSNPADTLLTLLDGLGFTDNYIECRIPTGGVYPIATANEKNKISDPLLTRFAEIDIPDYTPEEREIILRDYSMPRVLKRMGMHPDECRLTPDCIRAVVEQYADLPGVRSLEQAAEHIAANALYRIETEHLSSVTYDRAMVQDLLQS